MLLDPTYTSEGPVEAQVGRRGARMYMCVCVMCLCTRTKGGNCCWTPPARPRARLRRRWASVGHV
jgi:hypothetical protein